MLVREDPQCLINSGKHRANQINCNNHFSDFHVIMKNDYTDYGQGYIWILENTVHYKSPSRFGNGFNI